MKDIAIKLEGVSKKYTIGKAKDGSLRGTLANFFSKKENQSEDFWAVKDVSFEVKKGDVVGIIGKNGAGKSTLLKILSQITRPTEGKIEINGRIASLLEVGTGFHPELTGRENVFLNGTILGMTRKEVAAKFDEIVAFSGIEKFIDTPVKHYSSGMYVRLAFAVAAHLEPEILIIDEVLAVGDAEFQKKCLGKMKDVAGEGRTVLFVSHDLTAIKSLCSQVVYLSGGKFVSQGRAQDIIDTYLDSNFNTNLERDFSNSLVDYRNEFIEIHNTKLKKLTRENLPISVETKLEFLVQFKILKPINIFHLSFSLSTLDGAVVFSVVTEPSEIKEGIFEAKCIIPDNLLNYGKYNVKLFFVEKMLTPIYVFENAISFEVLDKEREIDYFGEWKGFIRPKLEFKVESINKKQ